MKYFTLLFISILFLHCGQQAGREQTTDNSAPDKVEQTETPPPAPVATYPSISAEKMKFLWDNCDYIDFVFYTTNFSMSQGDKNAIQATLSGVSTTIGQVDPACQPVGRVFFQVDGKNQEEADLFFGGNCLYYIFFEDGQYAYANQLTTAGMNFYQKIFTQVSTPSPPE